MKKRTVTVILSLVVLAGAVFGFATISRAADLSSSPAPAAQGICSGPALTAVAELVKLDVATLTARLQSGETLATIAGSAGASRESVLEVLVESHTARVEQLVATNRWSRATADAYLADLRAAANRAIDDNSTLPLRLGAGRGQGIGARQGIGSCGGIGSGGGHAGGGRCGAGNGRGR